MALLFITEKQAGQVRAKADELYRKMQDKSTDLAERALGDDVSDDDFWAKVDEIEGNDPDCLRWITVYAILMNFVNNVLISREVPA